MNKTFCKKVEFYNNWIKEMSYAQRKFLTKYWKYEIARSKLLLGYILAKREVFNFLYQFRIVFLLKILKEQEMLESY